MLFHNVCYECEVTLGKKNDNRSFYVIRCPQEDMGLFAVINYVVYHLGQAEKMGREPVVDWQYYPNKYFSEDEMIGKKNMWEAFFEQTTDISLKEVYQSKHVLMSSGVWELPGNELDDEEKILANHRIINKFIKLNAMTQNMLDTECARLELDKYKFIGVKCRGTDFVSSKPKGHSIVPDVQMTIEVVEQKMVEWGGFDRIYLSTEDEKIQNELKKYFDQRLFYTDGTRFALDSEKWLGSVYEENKESSKEEDMRNYLLSTYLLAKCDALIAPAVGGTIGAVRIKGKYEKMYIFRLGLY